MIILRSATGFTTNQRLKLATALDAANQKWEQFDLGNAINSYIQTDGKTPGFTYTDFNTLQVSAKLFSQDWYVDFTIETPPWWKRWFGRVMADESKSGLVTFESQYFNTQSIPSLAGTIAHETCHVAQFTHPVHQTYEWTNSVPEAVGNIMVKLVEG